MERIEIHSADTEITVLRSQKQIYRYLARLADKDDGSTGSPRTNWVVHNERNEIVHRDQWALCLISDLVVLARRRNMSRASDSAF